MSTFIPIAIAVFVLFVLWQVTATKWDIRIGVRPEEEPEIRGVANAKQGKIRDFFVNEVKSDCPIRILAGRERTGQLRTRIRGKIDWGTRQRIRNFLIDVL